MATSDQEEESMPTVRRWSELPTDLLSMISNVLKSEVDILRFRSVCSPWRSSLPLHPRKISFPLKLPVLSNSSVSRLFDAATVYCTLEETTFYHLSPPSHAPEPSNSWLFRVSEKNPNTFSLLHPLMPEIFSCPPGVLPKQLNLLDYPVSEICKSYTLKVLDCKSAITFPHMKAIVLWDYFANCDFAALVIQHDGRMSYLRLGDDAWTPIDYKDFHFHDAIFCQGNCYAVDKSGALVSLDSELNMSLVASAVRNDIAINKLVEFASELYMVSRILAPQKTFFIEVSKLNKYNAKWDPISDLGDAVIVLEASFSVSAKDFHGCKGNGIYLFDFYFSQSTSGVDHTGVYHLDEGRAISLSEAEDFGTKTLKTLKVILFNKSGISNK
ncbi:hypothetical protein V2J09_009533 [Rumex salicifolius]